MKRKIILLFFTSIFISRSSSFAQGKNGLSKEEATALEGIIIEKYYTSTKEDCKDTTGGLLPEGSVTYRIYADLKPGYHLQAVYGAANHPLFLKTSTYFFNNTQGGGQSGDQIFDKHLNENTVALDSWVTIGVATKTRFGILKTEDSDSSILQRPTLNKTDGLVLAGQTQKLVYYGFDLSFFSKAKNATYFYSNNGSWAAIGGGKGQTKDNRVLIAQLTTNGKLSFSFNLQVGAPNGATIQFVAKKPQGAEIQFKKLSH